jgi:hemerythrin
LLELFEEVSMFPFSIPWAQRELQRDLGQHAQTLPWSRDFELQPDELDSDHYHVWERINAMLRVLPTGDDCRIRMAYDSLAAAARNHFVREEARMRDIGFQDLEEHSQRHVELTRRLSEVRFSHLSAYGIGRHLGAVTVLERWFVPHLTHDDRRLADFVNAPTSGRP